MSKKLIVAGAVLLVGVAALAAVAVALTSAGSFGGRVESIERDQREAWEDAERTDPNLEAVRDALRRERSDQALSAPGVEVSPTGSPPVGEADTDGNARATGR